MVLFATEGAESTEENHREKILKEREKQGQKKVIWIWSSGNLEGCFEDWHFYKFFPQRRKDAEKRF
jgi:hypothetical protein